MSKSVSVVINTYDRAFCIWKTLDALQRLDYENYEVIVVNGPSSDNTEEVLARYADVIRIERCPEKNLSMSRNIGIRAAAGEIVAFIDDDGIPEPEWLNRIVARYGDPDVGAVGGPVFDASGYSYQARFLLADRFGESQNFDSSQGLETFCFPYSLRYPTLIGVNSSFCKKKLIDVGGFDEFFIYYLDETDVCLRLVDSGYTIEFAPDAYVHHKGAISTVRNFHMYARSNAYFVLLNARPFCTDAELAAKIEQLQEYYTHSVDHSVDLGRIKKENRGHHVAGVSAGILEANKAAGLAPRAGLLSVASLPASPPQMKRVPSVKHGIDKLVLCFLSQNYPPEDSGGIGRWTHAMAVGLAARGHDVHVLTKGQGNPAVEFEENVWVHRMPPELPDGSSKISDLGLPEWIQRHSFSLLKEIRRIDSHHHVDLVISPLYDLEGIRCLLDSDIRTLVTLQTTYQLMLENHPEWTSDAVLWNQRIAPIIAGEKRMLQEASHIHAISTAMIDTVREAYQLELPDERFDVVHVGIEDRYPTHSARRFSQNGVDILFVGRFEHRKGIDILMECIPSLCEEFPEAHFVLVGDNSIHDGAMGCWKDAFISQHNQKPWANRVMLTGSIPDEELYQWYAGCDVFVAPSRFESFGIIFLEAMMFGKPVIGSRAGGMVEIIDDMKFGRLIAPGDARQLREALSQLIADRDLRETMGQNARERFEKDFTRDVMIDRLEQYYQRICQKKDLQNSSSAVLGRLLE